MNGFLVRVVVTAAATMLCSTSMAGQTNRRTLTTNPYTATEELPPTTKAAHVHVTQGPAPELANSTSAIIRWTSNNPGGTDEHFGVVTYGTDPKNLNEIAKSHIRLNRNHPYTVFRVRVDGLQPRTTYYYTVDSMEGDGARDGVKSPVRHFTTR
jgi:phosphodiesterase/alkaline phosphatase D-like protein